LWPGESGYARPSDASAELEESGSSTCDSKKKKIQHLVNNLFRDILGGGGLKISTFLAKRRA
jgi:hypothetical protein